MIRRVLALCVAMLLALPLQGRAEVHYQCTMDGQVRAACCCEASEALTEGCCVLVAPDDAPDHLVSTAAPEVPDPPPALAPRQVAWPLRADVPPLALQQPATARGPPPGPRLHLRHCVFLN